MTESRPPLQQLVEIVSTLRGPDGCPWDREQTLLTMRPYLLEEVYELLEAMEIDAGEDGLEGELGDVLFVVLLITQIGADAGRLTLDSVAQRIVEKMITRHPHVFHSGESEPDPGGIEAWESRKQRTGRSRLAGVPASLPGLLRAHRQGEKAAAAGFDWTQASEVLEKVEEEMAELRAAMDAGDRGEIEHELGDVLMSLASLGRHLEVPPEDALRGANNRFARRFARLEALAEEQGISLGGSVPATRLEALWECAKKEPGSC